jgi:hypothetical protein
VSPGVLNIEELTGCDGTRLVLLPPTADKTDSAFVRVSRSTMTCCGVCSILLMVRGGERTMVQGKCVVGKVRFLIKTSKARQDRQVLTPDEGGLPVELGFWLPQSHRNT